MAHIGITCPSDHEVFSIVADLLGDRSHDVTFLDPDRPIDHDAIDALSLFVSKRTRPHSVRALLYAERSGVPTWNSATGVIASVSRFTQLCLLEGVGFPVPAASRTKPEGDYVAKTRFHWEASPVIGGEGDVYEELLPTEPIDYKYYVVHDGASYRATVIRATSKLFGEKRVLGRSSTDPAHLERIQALMERLDMRAVGVDLVRVDGDWVAVDLNPCPSFRGTGMEPALADSIESGLPDRAR